MSDALTSRAPAASKWITFGLPVCFAPAPRPLFCAAAMTRRAAASVAICASIKRAALPVLVLDADGNHLVACRAEALEEAMRSLHPLFWVKVLCDAQNADRSLGGMGATAAPAARAIRAVLSASSKRLKTAYGKVVLTLGVYRSGPM